MINQARDLLERILPVIVTRSDAEFNMQKIGFTEALDSIVASDPRYQRDAYVSGPV